MVQGVGYSAGGVQFRLGGPPPHVGVGGTCIMVGGFNMVVVFKIYLERG